MKTVKAKWSNETNPRSDPAQIERHRILDTLPSGKVGDRGASANGRSGVGQERLLFCAISSNACLSRWALGST